MEQSVEFQEQFPLDQVEVIRLKEVDSTNNHLRLFTSEKRTKEFVLAVAESQSAGRGQRGNSWESEAGKNLTFSIAIWPTFLQANNQFILSQAIALSTKESLDEYVDNISIKWPNDLYHDEKKIAGILIENDLIGKQIERSIIGVGINLNQTVFYSDAPNPISLWQITGQTVNPSTVLYKTVRRFVHYYEQIRSGNTYHITDRYEKALFRRNGFHRYLNHKEKENYPNPGQPFEAYIHSIEPDGHLILQTHNGEKFSFGFKEVEFLFDFSK